MKNLIILCCVVVCLSGCSTYEQRSSRRQAKQGIGGQISTGISGCQIQDPQSQFTNGLVAYYPFNGNARDESGNGNDGMPVLGAALTTNRFGAPNSAYRFDGVGSQILVPDTLFDPTVEAVTISTWITTDHGPYTGTGVQNIFEKGTKNGELTLCIDLARAEIRFRPNFAIHGGYISARAPVHSNCVMHLVAVYEKNQSISLYINAALASNRKIPKDNLLVSATFPLLSSIGGYYYVPRPYGSFRGIIDDVRVYNRALSSSEIVQLYLHEKNPVP